MGGKVEKGPLKKNLSSNHPTSLKPREQLSWKNDWGKNHGNIAPKLTGAGNLKKGTCSVNCLKRDYYTAAQTKTRNPHDTKISTNGVSRSL